METTFEIRITVRGRLSQRVAGAFDGMEAVHRHGTTELVGAVVDQAQLFALITRIRDLGLDLERVDVSRGRSEPPRSHGRRTR